LPLITLIKADNENTFEIVIPSLARDLCISSTAACPLRANTVIGKSIKQQVLRFAQDMHVPMTNNQ